WYLKRGLGILQEEGTVVLNFIPKQDRTCSDEFYQSEKINQCVVCGAKELLVKYYVVPQCYRKHFPLELKAHSSHDILLLCHDCHIKASKSEELFRSTLCKEYGITSWNASVTEIEDQAKQEAYKAATAFSKAKHTMPLERKAQLLQVLKDYFSEETMSEQELVQQGCKLFQSSKSKKQDIQKQIFQKHLDDILEYVCESNWNTLIVRWREHFVETMNPHKWLTFCPYFLQDHSIASSYAYSIYFGLLINSSINIIFSKGGNEQSYKTNNIHYQKKISFVENLFSFYIRKTHIRKCNYEE
ncbi:hypothetical protein RFI_02984, partial [Reticulomyxa filosa]